MSTHVSVILCFDSAIRLSTLAASRSSSSLVKRLRLLASRVLSSVLPHGGQPLGHACVNAHRDSASTTSTTPSLHATRAMNVASKIQLKSRRGCVQCKKRKVKCDEAHPTCRNCKRFGDKCHYDTTPSQAQRPVYPSTNPPPSTHAPESADGTASSSALSTSASSPAIDPTPNMSEAVTRRTDLELMHHFTAFTSTTLFDKEEKRAVFQRHAPKIALDKPYLMHAIFAVAAMHIRDAMPPSQSRDAQRYGELAVSHHGQALAELPADLQVAVERDYEPVFAFSGLLAIYSFTLAWQNVREYPDEDVLPNLVRWLNMTKGVESVVWKTGVADRILSGKFEILFSGYEPPTPEEVPLSVELAAQLDGLVHFAEWHETRDRQGEEMLSAYRDAVDYVRQAYRKFGAPPGKYCRVSAALAWPVEIKPTVVAALTEGKPPAVLIAMHFFVLMHRLKSYWWIGEGPSIMCRMLATVLPDDLQAWAQWPVEAVSRP